MSKTYISEGICSLSEVQQELTNKRKCLQEFMSQLQLDAILVSRHENIAWLTAGLVDIRVGILKETGSAAILVTKEGNVFYLTTNNEMLRLSEEEFAQLDMQAVIQPWYANDVLASIESKVGQGALGTDVPMVGMKLISLQTLRYQLTLTECERYRWLGRNVADVATSVLLQLVPGMIERAIQAKLSEALLARRIMPSVYLTAVDERICQFRHAVPREGILKKFGMVGFCARRWGLSASITRFVHFGRMPAELNEHFAAVADVNARLHAGTVQGASAAQLFDIATAAYSSLGYGGEEKMHHQGGATGYLEREWVARPFGTEQVTIPQAFAWNPNLSGAKVEDTILAQSGGVELLTGTPLLPQVTTKFGGTDYISAGVLLN